MPRQLSANFPELALKLASKSLEKAKQVNDKKNIARALTVLGIIDWRKGNLDQSLIRFFEAKEIAEISNDSARLGAVYINLANIYDDLFVFRKDLEAKKTSMKYALKAYAIYQAINDKKQLSVISNNLGTMYSERDKFDSALFFLNRALEIKSILNDTIKISSTINNIGLVYWRQSKFETALKYYNQSIILSQSVNDSRGLALAYMNKGNVLTATKRFDSGFDSYQNSLKNAQTIKSNK